MAKTVVVMLVCDRCKEEKGEEVEGTESVTFTFDGFNYSLDLCAPHAEAFHDTVQGLISWSSDRSRVTGVRKRTTSPASSAGTSATPARPATSDRERLTAIREWARKNGHPDLGDRGRIPQAIVAQYDEANA